MVSCAISRVTPVPLEMVAPAGLSSAKLTDDKVFNLCLLKAVLDLGVCVLHIRVSSLC